MKPGHLPLKFATLVIITGLSLGFNAGATVAEVVVVVSANNPLTTLSKFEVTDIFLGKTSRFPDGRQVVVIDQAEGSAARQDFYTRFAGKSAAQIKAYWSKIIFTGRGQPPDSVASDSEVAEFLDRNANAIGYIDRAMMNDRIKELIVE